MSTHRFIFEDSRLTQSFDWRSSQEKLSQFVTKIHLRNSINSIASKFSVNVRHMHHNWNRINITIWLTSEPDTHLCKIWNDDGINQTKSELIANYLTFARTVVDSVKQILGATQKVHFGRFDSMESTVFGQCLVFGWRRRWCWRAAQVTATGWGWS